MITTQAGIGVQVQADSHIITWVKRHPLIAFFVIAFAGEWIVTLPLVLAQNGLGLLPYTIPELGLVPLSYWFAVPAAMFGPTLASLVVTAVTAGKTGMQQLVRRYLLWRVGVGWYLFLLLGLPLIQLASSSVFLGAAPLAAFIQQWPLFFTSYVPNLLIIIAATQLWEEGGWSGFAVPNLQARFGAWRACLVFGPLWALFHLPFFFVPGQIFPTKVGASAIAGQMILLMVVATLLRIVMTWIFNNTQGSVLIAILVHAALDASNSASDYVTHLLSARQIQVYGLVSALLLPLIAAALLLTVTRGRLSYNRESK